MTIIDDDLKVDRFRIEGVVVVVVRGERVIVLQKPKSHHAAIRGVGRGVYPSSYLRKERQGWD